MKRHERRVDLDPAQTSVAVLASHFQPAESFIQMTASRVGLSGLRGPLRPPTLQTFQRLTRFRGAIQSVIYNALRPVAIPAVRFRKCFRDRSLGLVLSQENHSEIGVSRCEAW